ncbi:MAG: ArsR family transcriptional regulator [Candidatus Thorarchaeota archaeon]|nr:ArsR family transcriptional regulator [Candidatus Thorarchaeota archaeon]
MTLPELLSDPVRARIYLEVLLRGEVTAQELMDTIKISRSTMSHHLSKFVEAHVFSVRVQETGRSVKYYSHNPDFNEEVIIEGTDDGALRKRLMFLESASAHLQIISTLLLERAKSALEKQTRSKKGSKVSFTFTFLSKTEADVWNEEYAVFQTRFEERCKDLGESTDRFSHIGFGGIVPTK